MPYPIIIKASRRLVQEFHDSEYGLYEDKQLAIAHGDYDGPAAVSVEILDRRPEGIEIRNEEELRHIRWAIGSGTTALASWSMYRSACTLCHRLQAAAELLGVEFTRDEAGHPEAPEFGVGETMA